MSDLRAPQRRGRLCIKHQTLSDSGTPQRRGLFFANTKLCLIRALHGEGINILWHQTMSDKGTPQPTTTRAFVYSIPDDVWLKYSTMKRTFICQSQPMSDKGAPQRKGRLFAYQTPGDLWLRNPTTKTAFIYQHQRCLTASSETCSTGWFHGFDAGCLFRNQQNNKVAKYPNIWFCFSVRYRRPYP